MTTRVRELRVTTPQGEAGTLTKESRHVFAYGSREPDRQVSLTMPLRAESYAATPMLPAFAMNRPEGFLLERIQRAFKHVQLDDMALLAITGGNQIGRLRYTEPGKARQGKKAEVGLATLLSTGSQAGLFEYLVDTYLESGISGFQPKVMIPDADREDASPVGEKATATTPSLILKSAGEDYPHLAVNEYLCMSAAKRAGIEVPNFWLSDDQTLFVMERFDVVGDQQLGFEDMAVLMGKNHMEPNFKYSGSYENVVKAISVYCGEHVDESRARFFEYLALSVMVRNGDAHLKNFGLLYEHPHAPEAPRLSPLFDVVTTTVYRYQSQRTGMEHTDRTIALKLNKSVSYPLRDELHAFGRNLCHVQDPATVTERIADAMSATLAEEGDRLPKEFLSNFREEWDAGRASFEPARVFAARPPAAPDTTPSP
ncbi:type II toxin-antitoxin system HipA family toxin [Burkholderia vietnamiensis]|uniref:type II toxin-antitoxin system HipA family toxin n=1 Tax=Burkholderia vietnamiensis TaxID=60552 RepID=UPI001CF5E3A8|nr:type II toxin-antitoxin system HipA family toxin [Burkholderia vietnamiensis]MCA8198528.1 type II toxin-antitoxin system HipA family toxin [Burkholderia vietnamiensis]